MKGAFNFEFKSVSDANTKIQCNIVSKKTEKLTEGSGIVTIQAPDYSAKDVVVGLVRLGSTTLTGILLDSSNIGVVNKDITLKYKDKTVKFTTDKSGAWSQ